MYEIESESGKSQFSASRFQLIQGLAAIGSSFAPKLQESLSHHLISPPSRLPISRTPSVNNNTASAGESTLKGCERS